MTDLNALPALLARVEAATGGDREMDGDIAKTVLGWTCVKMKGDAKPYWRSPEQQREYYLRSADGPPRYTSSLDATVALVKKLRPDWNVVSGHSWMLSSTHPPTFPNYICEMEPRPQGSFRIFAYGATEPLARLAALLRSMIEEEGK